MIVPAALGAALGALVLVASAGCAERRYCRAETVTETPSGVWIAGAHGVAAFSDGRTIARLDYPSLAWRFRTSAAPEARIVMIRDEAWLFTREGGVLRRGAGGWTKGAVRWPARSTPLEIGFVSVERDGSLVVQLDPRTLAWSPPGPIGARWTVEPLPQLFRWMRSEGGALYGIGSQGGRRTVYRREAPGRWEPVAAVDAGWEILGLIRIPDGPLAIVTTRELWILEEGQAPTVVPASALAAGTHPTQPREAQPREAQPREAQPLDAPVERSEQDTRPAKRPLQIAAEPARSEVTGIFYVFEASGHGPLLLLSGDRLVEIGAKQVTVTPCPLSGAHPVGAATTPEGLRLVTDAAALIELGPGVPCRMVARPVIRMEEM